MSNEIKILCPPRNCSKCRRMKEVILKAEKTAGVECNVEVVRNLGQILRYPTWIFPTLVVNGRVIARGYIPAVNKIVSHFHQ